MSSDSQNQHQLDPSIYQYDQIYDQMKAGKNQPKNKNPPQSQSNHHQHSDERQRSRQKQTAKNKPTGSRYIKKMKDTVQEREKAHERAHEKKLEKQNQRLGIKQEEVFVTQSYLKKKREEKQQEKKQKQKQKYDQQHSILNKNKNIHDFSRKLLDQSSRKY